MNLFGIMNVNTPFSFRMSNPFSMKKTYTSAVPVYNLYCALKNCFKSVISSYRIYGGLPITTSNPKNSPSLFNISGNSKRHSNDDSNILFPLISSISASNCDEGTGFDEAWEHHKKCNKHHWQRVGVDGTVEDVVEMANDSRKWRVKGKKKDPAGATWSLWIRPFGVKS